MRAGRSTLLAVTLAVSAFVSPRRALADDAYRLSWSRAEGAEACLTEAELAQRVRSRLGREPFDDRAERTIEGQVGLGSDGFVAKLVIRGPDSAVLGRRTMETRGADCGPLGQAVTLAVVLAIAPNASLDEPNAAGPAPGPVPAVVPPSPPAPSAPRATVRVVESERSVVVRRRSEPDSARASVGAAVVGVAGLLPRAGLGAELEGAYPTAPYGLVIGLRLLPSVSTADGHLGVGVTSGKLGYCGSVTGGLALCGAFEGGVTTVIARDLVPVSPGDYPYLALSAGPRVTVPARGPLALQAGAAAVLPLYRHRFRVETAGTPGFRASAVAGLVFLGVRLGG